MSMEMGESKKAKILGQVRKLLDQASGTPYEAEADSARQKADQLMTQYAIESWELEKHKPKHEREVPARRTVFICEHDHIGKEGLRRLFDAVARHCRCKMANLNYNTAGAPFYGVLYGFPSDIDFAEALYTNLQLQLATELKPRVDPAQSFEQNLARLKESGMKWQEIHAIIQPGVPWERRHGVRYTGVYTKFCKQFGRERVYTSPTVFVRSFIEGYAHRVEERLAMIKGQTEANLGGTDIVLYDRSQEVNDFFKSQVSGSIRVADRKTDHTARRHGRQAADRADLGQPRMGGNRKELS